jgi:hypothetical protein
MKERHLLALGLFVAVGILFSSVPAFAIRSAPGVPKITITTKFGAALPTTAYRFDGEYYRPLNRVYFLGWRRGDDSTDGSVWYYDVAAKTYTDTGVDMLVPISNYQIAMLTDSHGIGLYTFGGRDNICCPITAVQAFYPATNQVRLITTDPWPGTTPSQCVSMPAMGVAVAQNKAYVLGGSSFSSGGCSDDNSAQTWIFDPMAAPGTRWTLGPDLNLPRGFITPTVLKGRIYAIGGDQNIAGTLKTVATVEAWKPGTIAWNDASIADLPQGCDESQAFAFASGPLASGIALMGCGQWPYDIPDIYFYDSVGNTWTDVGALQQSRRNHAGVFLGSKMFIFGGVTGGGGTVLDSSEFGQGGPLAGRPSFSRRGTRTSAGSHPSTN